MKKVGIIDIGSNTIRLALYEVNGATFRKLRDYCINAGLAGYINNRIISDEGLKAAHNAVKHHLDCLKRKQITSVYAFITAPARSVDNKKELIDAIESNGIIINEFTGKQEAEYGYLGATYGLRMSEGAMIDIGGGSSEVVVWKDKKVLFSNSIPFGSLSLSKAKNDPEEAQKFLKDLIDKDFPQLHQYNCKNVLAVGGSSGACFKVYRAMQATRVKDNITVSFLDSLVDAIIENDLVTVDIILNKCPERKDTLMHGAIILSTLSHILNAENIIGAHFGIKEGVLIKNFM